MRLRAPGPAQPGPAPAEIHVANNLILSPRFAALVRWFDQSVKRYLQSGSRFNIRTQHTERRYLNYSNSDRATLLELGGTSGRAQLRLHRLLHRDNTIRHQARSVRYGVEHLSRSFAERAVHRLVGRGIWDMRYSDMRRVAISEGRLRLGERHLFTGRTTTRRRSQTHSIDRMHRASLIRTEVVWRALRAQAARGRGDAEARVTPGGPQTALKHRAAAQIDTRRVPALSDQTPLVRRPAAPFADRVFRAPERPLAAQAPHAPERGVRHAPPPEPKIDMNRLEADLWQRFERRVRIERERRGRH